MRRFAPVLLLLAAACGDDAQPKQDPWSGDPAADLQAALTHEATYERLKAWPRQRPGYAEAPATQVALTERLLMHVEHGALNEAYEDSELLRVHFDEGRRADGKTLAIGTLRAGLTDAAIEKALALVAGDRPHREKALEALIFATRLRADDDDERVQQALRWVSMDKLEAIPTSTTWAFSKYDGPRVVMLTDHFSLGEEPVRAVLERWARRPGLRVSLVPVWRDNVRVGLRRVPASRKDERRAMQAAARALGMHYEADAAKVEWEQALGLDRTASVVLVLNAQGVVVGRLMATFPNLQRLEGTVQRVTTR